MQRDIEILRAVLLDAESPGAGKLGRWTDEQVEYHRALLIEAGYLRGSVYRAGDLVVLHADGLTMTGHDFLDATRSPDVWQAVRNRLREFGSTVAFEIVGELAKDSLRRILNLKS